MSCPVQPPGRPGPPGHGFATEDSADLDRGSIEIEGNVGDGLPPSRVLRTDPIIRDRNLFSYEVATSGRGSTPGAVRSPQGSVPRPHSQSCLFPNETVSTVLFKFVNSLRGYPCSYRVGSSGVHGVGEGR